MLDLQTTGAGVLPHRPSLWGGRLPALFPRLGVLFAPLPERVSYPIRQLAQGEGRLPRHQGGRHDRPF